MSFASAMTCSWMKRDMGQASRLGCLAGRDSGLPGRTRFWVHNGFGPIVHRGGSKFNDPTESRDQVQGWNGVILRSGTSERAEARLRRERASAMTFMVPGTCKTRRSCWPEVKMSVAAFKRWL